MSHAEVAGAAEDLQLMTRENQAITSELAGLLSSHFYFVLSEKLYLTRVEVSFERDRLMERVSELSVAASNLEQARRGK